MNTNVAKLQPMNREKLITTLQNSLYAGAKSESVEMVISYCDATGLDVMQKPVHIVPMNTKNPVSGNWEWRDVVMPGIGMYRIQADRSGTLAGSSEPEFGDEKTQTFNDKNGNPITVTYPEWCKVAMKKLVGNQVVEFIAKEYWIENYATDSGKSDAPNTMWRKRPRGQLAKCAEAQALRKGWPEIGQAATAEEMEGKIIDMGDAEVIEPETVDQLPECPQEHFEANADKWKAVIDAGKGNTEGLINKIGTKYTLNEDQINEIKSWEK